jgi:hypothetical protein
MTNLDPLAAESGVGVTTAGGGTKPREERTAAQVSTDLGETTCRFCRAKIGLDDSVDAGGRLAALFVAAFTLGMRPGRKRGAPEPGPGQRPARRAASSAGRSNAAVQETPRLAGRV